MGQIKVPYGNGYQEAELPDNLNVEVIDPPEREKQMNVREFDTSKLKRIPQSLETGLFFVKFLFLLYSNI